MRKFDLNTLIKALVAAGIIVLVSQVLRQVLQQPALATYAMMLLLSLLAAIVKHYFFSQSG